MFKKVTLIVLFGMLFSFSNVSAQEVSSQLSYQIELNKNLSAEVKLTQTVKNNTSDSVITSFNINIPFKDASVKEVLFNGGDANTSISKVETITSINFDLSNSVIKPSESGIFTITISTNNLIEEVNGIYSLKIDESVSNFPISDVNFQIDYLKTELGELSFFSSEEIKNEDKVIKVNDNKLLLHWIQSKNFNISFLQKINSEIEDDVLFNFINEESFSKVTYSDVTKFTYGLQDADNNHYGVTRLAKGDNTIGYIASVQPAYDYRFIASDDADDLININLSSVEEYDNQKNFLQNLRIALSRYKDIPTSTSPKFKSVNDYYKSKQNPLDQCLLLNELGKKWNFEVAIYAGLMMYDYPVLDSNQNIWCKIAHEGSIYSVDYSLEQKTGYSFIFEGNFADRLPLIRINQHSIKSFFIKHFNDLNLSLNEISTSLEFEPGLSNDLTILIPNETNYAGESVLFKINIKNNKNVFSEISSIKINNTDINLNTYEDYSYSLVPLNQNEFFVQAMLERDLFASQSKGYEVEIKLENSEDLKSSGTINLVIDVFNLVLNITLLILIVILILHLANKYRKRSKGSFVKK